MKFPRAEETKCLLTGNANLAWPGYMKTTSSWTFHTKRINTRFWNLPDRWWGERIEGENRGQKKENEELCFESVGVVEGCFWSSEGKRFWVFDSILSQNCQLSVKAK